MRPHHACRPSRLVFLLLIGLAWPALAHSPHDVINVVAVSEGADGEQVIFARAQLTSKGLFVRSFDSGRTWSVTALPVNEREISRIAFSPDFAVDHTAFVATTDLGILKSTDRGDSWTLLNSGGLDLRVLDLVVSPDFATTQKLVAATAIGTMISNDGGDTWVTEITGLTQVAQSRLAVASTNPDVLLAGKTVLHRSDDGGLTWTPLWTFPAGIEQLEVSPSFNFDGQAILCLANGQGIWSTSDGGTSWQAMVLGLPEAKVNDVALGRQGKAYAVTPVEGLFRATLGGTWEAVGTGFELLSDLTTNHFRSVDLSPGFALDDNVWVGGFEGLFRSEDGGSSFRPMDIYHQKYVRTVVFAPDYATSRRIFLQLYGGGLLTTPPTPLSQQGGSQPPGGGGGFVPGVGNGPAGTGPETTGSVDLGPSQPQDSLPLVWEDRSGPITALFGQCFALSPDWPAEPTAFYAQTGIWRSDDGARTWTTLSMPPGTVVLRALTLSPEFASDRLLLVGAGLGGGAFRSEDAGASWVQLTAGLPASPSPGAYLFSPGFGGDQTVYLADRESGFYVSTDRGDSWTPSNLGLDDTTLQCLVMSPDFANDQTLLTGASEGGVFRSTDGGASWVAANAGLPAGLPLSIESLALSPDFANDQTAYAAVLQAGTFRSTDGGQSWTPVGPGLPADAPRVVALSPAYPSDGTVLVSTHSWTWISEDAGQSWERLPGYARIDNNNNVLVQVGSGQDAAATDAGPGRQRGAGLTSRYAGLDPGLLAFLLDGACESRPATDGADDMAGDGDAYAASSGNVVDLSWPVEAWPEGALAVGVSVSATPGEYVELDFFGDSVAWYAPRGPDMGKARLIIDGQLIEIVDLYAPTDLPADKLFSFSFQEVGQHRVRLLNAGAKNPAASAAILRSDGFDYTY